MNKNLQKAKKIKNDEFYTMYEDIEKEVDNYKEQMKGKTILCNCDNPEISNFWKYFKDNFKDLKIKRLISTHYNEEGASYKLEYDGVNIFKTELKGNGDFRSEEVVNLLEESDIVITNPPFSLFREFVSQLIHHNKLFLIIGNQNAITYKDVFKLLKDDKVRLGYNYGSFSFMVPNSYDIGSLKIVDGKRYSKLGNIAWFTNLIVDKKKKLPLYSVYKEENYPKYDNFDAINVNKVADIPIDYDGLMGVPITFMHKHNPEQFEIIGNLGSYAPDGYSLISEIFIKGNKVFKRILIKKVL